jgi:hypothetical protein
MAEWKLDDAPAAEREEGNAPLFAQTVIPRVYWG